MNALLARVFVVLNEILAVLAIVAVLVGAFVVYRQQENVLMALGAFVGGLVTVVYFYGFFAVVIENHKALKEIAKNISR